MNLGQTKIQGVDVDARFRFPAADIGQFTATVTGTYYIQYQVQQGDGSFAGFVSNAFQAPGTGITPRWKSYAALNWTRGPWTATLGNSYQSSYVDFQPDPDGNLRRAGSLSLWDIQGSYTGFKNLTLTLGAKNLFDTNPPVTRSTLSRSASTRPTTMRARDSCTEVSRIRSSRERRKDRQRRGPLGTRRTRTRTTAGRAAAAQARRAGESATCRAACGRG